MFSRDVVVMVPADGRAMADCLPRGHQTERSGKFFFATFVFVMNAHGIQVQRPQLGGYELDGQHYSEYISP